jgi:nucleoid DNA-binding protein
MAKINYGIFPNPLPDAEGKTTYQVRHVADDTMDERKFLAHLKGTNIHNATQMLAALSVLKDEIVEQLQNNRRFRIDGIGTFQIKVGLKVRTDEQGNPIKPHFTDPDDITARDVEVQGVSFTPDITFIRNLQYRTSTQNVAGRGISGRNKPYSREQIVAFLDSFLREHHSMTRREMQRELNITEYRAKQWLDMLTAEPYSHYYSKQRGKTIVYYRHGWEQADADDETTG